MAQNKQKYYVVWKGNKPGIYDNWNECKTQVLGFNGAVFKAFISKNIALEAFKNNPEKYLNDEYVEEAEKLFFDTKAEHERPILESLSVDAACAGNPGILEYQGVSTGTRIKLFHQGPFPEGTVNIGEFLAIVHGLAHLKKVGSSMPIYTDSITAISWVKRKAINTNLVRNAKNEQLFQLVDRALIWLKSNQWNNPIIKWKTDVWGEIPADFGRK